MDSLKKLCEFLNESKQVSRFQRMCGIVLESDEFFSRQRETYRYNSVEKSCGCNLSKQVSQENHHISNGHAVGALCENGRKKIGTAAVDLNSNEKIPSTVPFKITNNWLFYFFKFVSFFGSEPFYFLFYPFCMWNLDIVYGRKVSVLWGFSLYFGGVIKDYLCWPRPRSPPVAKLEHDFSQEFAMPSTHAMAGTAMSFTTCYLLVQRYHVPVVPAIICGLLYPIPISLSRLYLGVHSILDLVCGILLSTLLCCLVFPFLSVIDWYLQTSVISPVIVIATAYALCFVFYPTPKVNNSTKYDSVHVVGVMAGFYFGAWVNYWGGLTTMQDSGELYSVLKPTIQWVTFSTLRLIVGFPLSVVLGMLAKIASIKVMSLLLGLKTSDPRHPTVRTVYKFVSYATIGLAMSSISPYLFSWLGIVRPAFYSEMF